MELVFASDNAHKLQEAGAILGTEIRLISLKDAGIQETLPETSGTIEGNALQKALRCFNLTGKDCIADDSGLEVFALNGRPGVDSAHYAGPERDNNANIRKLLTELKGIENREARFVTVIALIVDGRSELFRGEVRGWIAETPEGDGGFGYDPVFVPEGFSRSFARFSADEKNAISHRRKALDQLKRWLGTQKA